ncbi:CPBP family intramembrane glutamic endopeptidase [Aliiroseovarius sp.]|uniref:CPBP family intramembrane glutamic endopeptidase n=1 Tax=Aliiroseovarius sp. TaxID=1872442 RepID=UPI003BAD7571
MTRQVLWFEFLLLFVLAPVAIAALLPATAMFPALFAVTLVGIVLLQFTRAFHWRELRAGPVNTRQVVLFGAGMVVLCLGLMVLTAPGQLFNILRERPLMMLAIALFYPVVSALPQELVFRPLFFRRYGPILPDGRAALFSLAHLMYWSWIVAAMTFAGGLIFAHAYEVRRSFPMAVALHSIAGVVIFATGMGIYFYSGNVTRPF